MAEFNHDSIGSVPPDPEPTDKQKTAEIPRIIIGADIKGDPSSVTGDTNTIELGHLAARSSDAATTLDTDWSPTTIMPNVSAINGTAEVPAK